MTKQKISITLDEETLELVESMLENKSFRNRSHVIELALNKFMESRE